MRAHRHTHACESACARTHTHRVCEGEVLGSRLSRPGSPLAALSQLRMPERGWLVGEGDRERGKGDRGGRTAVVVVVVVGELGKSSRGHLSQ